MIESDIRGSRSRIIGVHSGATVAALNGHLGLELSQKEIAALSYRIEKEVQRERQPHGYCSGHIWRLPEDCR